MGIIKLAFISFLFLFGILTIISLFIPSHIRFAKVITIRAEKDSIFSMIRNKDQWYRWHPAFANDDKKENLDKISTNIVADKDSILNVQWQQTGKRSINNTWQLYTTPGNQYGNLQWYIDFHLSWYPWEKFGSLFFESNYGKMMEQGLLNIKKEIEATPQL